MVYAALDLGTNNCRMLIARPVPGGGFKVVDAFSRITRLGEGVAATGVLCQAAMDRTIDALKACAAKAARHGVGRVRLVATEACRRAANRDAFAHRVRLETGLILETVGAEEEAALALAGCAALLDPACRLALVFDIGGGSTELLWVRTGAKPEVVGVHSLPLGVVTLAEACAPLLTSLDGYRRVVGDIAGRLAPFEAMHNITRALLGDSVQMLGTSGTVTTLGAVALGLDRYDRAKVDGLNLDFTTIARISRDLAAMTARERARLPCIGFDRADLVVAGCAILEAMCGLWPLGRLTVADRGVREGILQTMMAQDAGRKGAA